MNVNFYCEESRAVLWWEKPYNATPEWNYVIKINGEVCGITNKTHYTIENLLSDKEYQCEIYAFESVAESLDDMMESSYWSAGLSFRTSLPSKQIDVTKTPYFAVGDGKTLNTKCLQQAIDECPAGCSLYFPAGTYLTGALRLHSHMALYLEDGATLKGSSTPEDYLPRIHSRFEGKEIDCYQSLLNMGELDHTSGPNCEDIVIHGKGSIIGGGYDLAWAIIESERERLKEYLAENDDFVATCENIDTIPGRVRGRLINMSNCKDIRISGLTLGEGPSWNVHMIYSDNIITDHCTFVSKGIWNGDGWDPDSSTNCTLFASTFYTEDDSVAIKSGKNPEGNVINRPTKHIRVFDCYSAFGHGICMGSEMSGGIEDVKIWDCNLENSMYGIEIKGTRKRGGYVRDIEVRDCIVPCLSVHSVLYNDDGVGAKEPPKFENFYYEGVTITGKSLHADGWHDCIPIELRGFDEDEYAVKYVSFKNVDITNAEKNYLDCCKEIYFE